MPQATHRIVLNPDAHNDVFPWDWSVYTLEGDVWLSSGYAKTIEEAEEQARAYIAAEAAEQPARVTLYTDSQGQPAEAPAE